MKYNKYLLLILLIYISDNALAQKPVFKVDLNFYNRQESEVNEPGYTSWVIATDTFESKTFGSVAITFKGGSFSSDWYKAGVQYPYYARLVNDGLITGGIDMHIKGLPAGEHTLLTYHNTFASPESNTFSPIDIYVNGVLTINNLVPSNRVTSNYEVKTAYIKLVAKSGKEVIIHFEPDKSSTVSWKSISICGFELNTPDVSKQAIRPFPENNDEHVNADSLTFRLCWSPAKNAVSHDVYIGNDFNSINNANHISSYYKGNQRDTNFNICGLTSLKTYYWRIDEIDSYGDTTRGTIWYFRPRQNAFIGAEGYGRYAIGGRWGKVVEVTNLEDSGPGSLREAVTNDIGPRTVVFNVSGIITLKSRLTITQPYITIAGQTAPGKGICIRSAPFGMSGANDVIIRNVRVRLGSGTTYDGMGMNGSNHCIIDHCSVSWTIDEAFSSRNAKNITLQRTILSEALNIAGHQNYPDGTAHGYAASISGDIGTFHHNLLAHCYGRNWSLAGGLDPNGFYSGRLDIFNNVVYNWGKRSTDGGAHEVNFAGNYYKPGPATTFKYALNAQYDGFPGTQRYFFSGNEMPGVFNELNQESGRKYSGTPDGYSPWVDSAFFLSYAEIQKVKDAYKNVLSDVGCTQPVFDNHDVRIIRETSNGSFTYKGSRSGLAGLPDSEKDVGGWENYPERCRKANWDSDHDGLPDWWEKVKGLNPNSDEGDFSDSNGDLNLDGYTNLEDYLDWMAIPHNVTAHGISPDINLKEYSRGYTANPVYSVSDVINGTAVISKDSLVHFTPDQTGLASFKFKVTDNEGSSMVQRIGIFVGEIPEDTLFEKKPNEIRYTDDSPFLYCYPNPATNYISVSGFSENFLPQKLIVSNIVGKKLIINIIQKNNDVKLDISSLEKGIYFITLKFETKQKTIRFIKQ